MTSASPNGGKAPNGEPADRSPRFADHIGTPAEVLARHGARMIDPAAAVRAEDGTRPLSSAYQADTLLIPAADVESLLPDRPNDYNAILSELKVELRAPEDRGWNEIVRGLPEGMGIAIPLVRQRGAVAAPPPDPWAALVALRTAFGSDRRASQVGLNHLLAAASLTVEGTPYTGGGAVGGNNGSGAGSFTLHTGDRNPVQVMARKPARRAASEIPLRRRPVICVVDTGIGEHPWLPVGDVGTDPVVEISEDDFQKRLAEHEKAIAEVTGVPVPALYSAWESRDEIQPLLGLTDSHSGHGTFVTGLVHQTCPDARVLSLRMLHTDGYSSEGAFLRTLEWLRRRVSDAQKSGDTDKLIDVVSLSLGFYPETTTPEKVAQVGDAIKRLTDLGVIVVAAAGNNATTRPFLPAALGQDVAATSGNPLVAAIGALNASGVTTAAFSNAGQWISRWAPGNALVSTVPVWQGTAAPRVMTVDGPGPRLRTSPDEDDLTTGFAVWAGTSFATPVVAGFIGNALADDVSAARMPMVDRAFRALQLADDELTARGWR